MFWTLDLASSLDDAPWPVDDNDLAALPANVAAGACGFRRPLLA